MARLKGTVICFNYTINVLLQLLCVILKSRCESCASLMMNVRFFFCLFFLDLRVFLNSPASLGKKWLSLIVSWFWLKLPMQSEAELQSPAEWKCWSRISTQNKWLQATLIFFFSTKCVQIPVYGFQPRWADTGPPSGSAGHALDKSWLLMSGEGNAIRDQQFGSVILIVSLRLSWWLWTHYGLQNSSAEMALAVNFNYRHIKALVDNKEALR